MYFKLTIRKQKKSGLPLLYGTCETQIFQRLLRIKALNQSTMHPAKRYGNNVVNNPSMLLDYQRNCQYIHMVH